MDSMLFPCQSEKQRHRPKQMEVVHYRYVYVCMEPTQGGGGRTDGDVAGGECRASRGMTRGSIAVIVS